MSALRVPTELKREFKSGFEDYIKAMGRCVDVYLKPYEIGCPNCISDVIQKKSMNVWNVNFLRAVNIFVGTPAQRTVFPQPFNVSEAPGVVFDPAIPNPRILRTSVCPVCKGQGTLTAENKEKIVGVITIGILGTGAGNAKSPHFMQVSAGYDGREIYRIKTYAKHYAVCREAKHFKVDGITLQRETIARVKGLGGYHITEVYLVEVSEDSSVTNVFDSDARIKINEKGQMSDQAPLVTPTIPPIVPGDDVW